MRKSLMKMPIDQRYQFIRSTYEKLDKDITLTMQVLFVSKNTIYSALSITNPQTRVYEEKLKEVHKNYIHGKESRNAKPKNNG